MTSSSSVVVLNGSQSSLMASSSTPRTWRYRVFTSFHGPDVRKTFLSHLRKQFNSNGITMFDDQGIERGETIASALTKAISESRILIVVLSKNYASSRWCLDELLEILKCNEVVGQIVMTVFYGVDPYDVRNQTGEFGRVFMETCEGKTEEEIRRWCQALKDVGNIAGEHFLNWDSEANMIEKIARDVSNKLNVTPSWDFGGMVGLEAHLMEMESLLDLDYNGVKIVAIYGPAGIGKTTIARAFHIRFSNRFQLTCFVENLRESYHRGLDEYGLKLRLQEKLLSSILNQDGTRICHLGTIKERLCDLKVLIVLDDVNDIKQLEALANEISWFGPGSRIIVATENKKLLHQHGINNTYNVEFPSDEDALKILCRYAFRKITPPHGFEELAKDVTKLCANLPLGLRVVGSCLQGENEDAWEYTICRLKTNIDRDIEDVLRVGYETLNENEQTLFLHIAVFFNNNDGDLVKAMLADSNLDIKNGLKLLVNRSLIYISDKGEIRMHNLLQQVGKQAIHREEPWRRKILIDAQEICDVLENETGTRIVSGISFDTSGIKEVTVSNKALRRMCNLRFLRVYKTRHDGNDRVLIPEEMEYPPRLRLLHWEPYPCKSLPLGLCVQNLVELNMKCSQLERLWEGTQALTNLKKMDLSMSVHLKEIPNLSNATNLETLDLSDCTSLVEVPSSIGNLHKLEELEMNGCSRLRTFPNISTNIGTLYLMGTAVEEVPASIKHWSRLCYIDISYSRNLKTLTHLPESIEMLDLCYTDIVKIPDCINGFQVLRYIYLCGCKKLTSLPELPGSLSLLEVEDCESLERVTCPLNTPKATLHFTNCFKLNEEARREIIKRSYLDRGFACLPGRVIPSEFNHKAKGTYLTIPLSYASSTFKACVMTEKLHLHVTLRCSINKSIWLEHRIETIPTRTKHLCIFHGDMPEVSGEALFEFFIEANNPLYNYKVIECGVRIMTDEPEISSEDYDDASYKFELNEVLEDFENEVISCDSESENVEGEKKHITDCWSWLFTCLDLSCIVSNIRSLCWRQENRYNP